MNQEKNQFRLEIRKDGLSPMKIDVVDSVSVGHDPRNDLVLIGKKIQNKHLLFEMKGENLALKYLGLSNQTFLNNLPLEEGRTYLLDIGDVIDVTDATITILNEKVSVHETQQIKPKIFETKKLFDDNVYETLEDQIVPLEKAPEERPVPKIEEEPVVKKITRPSMDLSYLLVLWGVKIYAIVVDMFLTYFILSTLLPLIHIDKYAHEILFYLRAIIFPTKEHSIFGFLIPWFMLSFAQTLIFGNTIGQFVVGLRHETGNSFFKILLSRLKTFFFSLLLLPAQNTYKTTLFYRAMRKGGLIVILISLLVAPFFLPPPFNTEVTLMEDLATKKELHTQTVDSASNDLGMTLQVEIPFRYLLLPIITGGLKKRAFQFIDLKEGHSIIIDEKMNFTYPELQSALEYANPLYKTLRPAGLESVSLETKKDILTHVMLLSPVKIKDGLFTLGPFLGGAVILKSTLLNKMNTNDVTLKTYRHQTPLMYLSSSQQDFFYLMEKKRMSRFVIEGKNKKVLGETFEQMVLSKLVDMPEGSTPNFTGKKVSILEAQDAFLHGDEKTILTYYSAVATSLGNTKMIYEDVDLTDKAKLALKANIESVLKFLTDRSVENSLKNLINQLTPMEKPGGNDE